MERRYQPVGMFVKKNLVVRLAIGLPTYVSYGHHHGIGPETPAQ